MAGLRETAKALGKVSLLGVVVEEGLEEERALLAALRERLAVLAVPRALLEPMVEQAPVKALLVGEAVLEAAVVDVLPLAKPLMLMAAVAAGVFSRVLEVLVAPVQ